MPRFTRQDFEFIADEIAPMLSHPSQISTLAATLRVTNKNFNRDRFIDRATQAWEDEHIDRMSAEIDDNLAMTEGRI